MGKQFLLNMWHPSCNFCYIPNDKSCNFGFQLYRYNIVFVSITIRGIESVFIAYDIIVWIILGLILFLNGSDCTEGNCIEITSPILIPPVLSENENECQVREIS